MTRKTDSRQMDLFAVPDAPVLIEAETFTVSDALATMRVILKQYHLSAVAGSAAMQLDAVNQFRDLVPQFNALYPAMTIADCQD